MGRESNITPNSNDLIASNYLTHYNMHVIVHLFKLCFNVLMVGVIDTINVNGAAHNQSTRRKFMLKTNF